MNTGSRDEKQMLAAISSIATSQDRIAHATERIANAVEQHVYGITGPEVGNAIHRAQQAAALLVDEPDDLSDTRYEGRP